MTLKRQMVSVSNKMCTLAEKMMAVDDPDYKSNGERLKEWTRMVRYWVEYLEFQEGDK